VRTALDVLALALSRSPWRFRSSRLLGNSAASGGRIVFLNQLLAAVIGHFSSIELLAAYACLAAAGVAQYFVARFSSSRLRFLLVSLVLFMVLPV